MFAAIFGYFLITIAGLLVLAYQKNNQKLILIFRIALVVFTVAGFFNIFIDNMIFTDARPDLLQIYANGG